jgi:hypothetical protein
MGLQLPLNVDQTNKVAERIMVAGRIGSKQLTASEASKSFIGQWNRYDYYTVITNKQSTGGTMSLSVAASVVRSMTETQIESRLKNGRISLVSVIPPSEIMSLPTVSNVKAKPSVKILPFEIITEQNVTTMSAQVMYLAFHRKNGYRSAPIFRFRDEPMAISRPIWPRLKPFFFLDSKTIFTQTVYSYRFLRTTFHFGHFFHFVV